MAWPVFFLRHAAADEEAVKPGHRDVQADFDECQAQLRKRDVFPHFPDRENVRLPFFDLA
jgi:hypothetical protein